MGWIVFACVFVIIVACFWYEWCDRKKLSTRGAEVVCIICIICLIAAIICIALAG